MSKVIYAWPLTGLSKLANVIYAWALTGLPKLSKVIYAWKGVAFQDISREDCRSFKNNVIEVKIGRYSWLILFLEKLTNKVCVNIRFIFRYAYLCTTNVLSPALVTYIKLLNKNRPENNTICNQYKINSPQRFLLKHNPQSI